MNASLIVAVAIGDQVERFGSYFGYAAIIGIGVLSLLYFAQAREVKRLREWAGRAPERDAELAERVQADAQRRVVAQPIPAPSPAVAPVSPQTAAAQDAARKAAAAAVVAKVQGPGVPAPSPGVGPPGTLARTTPAGAPGSVPPPASPGPAQPPPGGAVTAGATAGATTAAPDASSSAAAEASAAGIATPDAAKAGSADAAGSTPATSGPGSAAATPGAPGPGSAAATPGAPGSGAATATPDSGSGTAVPPGMSPATASAVAAARGAVAPSRTVGPAYANGAGQETHESDAARPAPYPDLPPRPSRTVANAPTDDDGPRSRMGAIIAGVCTLLVIAVVLVVVLSSGGGDPKPTDNEIGDATPPPAAQTPPPAPAAAKVNRADTQVAVLNGTTTTGLARGVADKLEKSGFTILSVGDNADQAIATTTISYSTGNERAARTVAQIMDVSSAAVKPIDANTSVAVAPEAKVVVIVGNDRSTTG